MRWLMVFIVAFFAWRGWRVYVFQSALKEAEALGWDVDYTNPSEEIRANWKAAFKQKTWLDGVTWVPIKTCEEFEQNSTIIHRLNPKALRIIDCYLWQDLSAVKSLTRLERLDIWGGVNITNLDALKNLSRLKEINFSESQALTNVDAFKNLPSLQQVWLRRCTGLTNLDGFKYLSALQVIELIECTALKDVDALKNLPALHTVQLSGCTGLTNLDGLKNISTLQEVNLSGCTSLTPEAVASLKSTLPKTRIYGP